MLVVVAERMKLVVGVIAMDVRTEASGDETARAQATSHVLAVALGHQRQYIGYNLKYVALNEAARRGSYSLASEVDEDNLPML